MLIRASAGAMFQKRFAVIYTDVQLSPVTVPSGKVRGLKDPLVSSPNPVNLAGTEIREVMVMLEMWGLVIYNHI